MAIDLKTRLNVFGEKINAHPKLTSTMFFLFVLILALMFSSDNTDFYFLIENGREIVENGFPRIDYMSMHEGLALVLQQWVVDVADFLVYDNFGNVGIRIMDSLLVTGTGVIIYACYVSKTNNYAFSMLASFYPICLTTITSVNPRPTTWTVLILSAQLLVCIKSQKPGKQWLFLTMPLFSLAQANVHGTFWVASIGITIVFMAQSLAKNRALKNVIVNLAIALASVALGFANPYGWKSIFQIFLTGNNVIYDSISELQPVSGWQSIFLLIIPLVVYIIVLLRNKHELREQFPLAFLYLVSVIASVFAVRSCLVSIVVWAIAVSQLCKASEKTEKRPVSKEGKVLSTLLVGVLCLGLYMVTPSETVDTGFLGYRQNTVAELSDYFESNNIDSNNKTFLASNIDWGQYVYHYLGMRPFIDARLEVYLESFNGKHDYDTEYSESLLNGTFNELAEKYEIDYVFVENDSFNNYVLSNDERFDRVLVTTSKDDSSSERKEMVLYERLN